MKKVFMWSLMLLSLGLNLTSCSSNDDPIIINDPVTLSLEMPLNLENVEVTNSNITLTNVSSSQIHVLNNAIEKTSNGFVATFNEVEEGTYDLHAEGELSFTINGVAGTSKFEVSQDNINLSRTASSMKVTINTFTAKGGFVISEVFFTGTTTPEGKQYSNDQYVVITNNSDVTLYADSIAFLESSFLTVNNYEYVPDISKDTMAVAAVYMIPGNGTSVPVEPGKSLTLAVNAINHLEGNANSIDLRGADYEFYDISSNPTYNDVDNTSVPNLDKWYCYTATLYSMHNRGFKSMAIAKMKESKENWLEKYAYNGKYVMSVNGNAYEMKVNSTYKVPMSWVIDGVNLSVEEEWQWNVLPANIDSGWTYCGKTMNDKTRYSKAVIRKTDNEGKYVDTNNSANDFIPEAKPSMFK
ncbi:Protein of unknown function [Prevotella sp. khp7]|jgi:hypothetical protein|uniref:DUF4876 domain-containing protein n=1 Tax=Prevotella sp. khp7 TaxID=1761885 RepID=UPI0008CF8E64|nr:DUF4876 domain-containing protein [Prevotella sp. khp7]SEW28424.1 Protein of unknown function [Prevotella sp. khp7]